MATLRVRAYNVRFGDAILVTVPDRDPQTNKTTKRHILIDVGNVLNKAGGSDEVFKPAIDDIVTQLDGRPIDLYVMTHEHLDHVQGLFHVATKVYPNGELARKMPVDFAWLTASAHADYYDTHPEAKKKKDLYLATYRAVADHLALGGAAVEEPFRTFLLNNDPRNTGQCVSFLRKVAREKTSYVFRGSKLEGTHPFQEAKLQIWAPEEDTSEYYGSFQPMALATAAPGDGGALTARTPTPPPGVDAGAFYNLVGIRSSGVSDNLLAIDQAANNSSVVFSLEWRGWRLLFSGDAEIRSWKTMHREQVLKPVHFLKVSHHGSHNGTPDGDILEAILPEVAPDARPRSALISTYHGTYSGIPHGPTNVKLKQRCSLQTTLTTPVRPFVDLTFDD